MKKIVLRDAKGIAEIKQKRYKLDENLIKNKNGLKLPSQFLTKDGRKKVNVLKYFVMNQIDKCDDIYFKTALEEQIKIMKKYPNPKPEDSDSDSDDSDTESEMIKSIDWGNTAVERYKEMDYDEFEKFSDSFRRPNKNKKYIYPKYSQEDQTELDRLNEQSNTDIEEYKNINNRLISAITQADQSEFGEITVINDAIGENSFLYKDLTNMPSFCVNKNFDGEDRKNWSQIINAAMTTCKKNVMFIYSHTFDPENPDNPDESSIMLHSVVLFRITFKKNLKDRFYSSTDSKWVLYIDLLCTNQSGRGRLDNPGSSRLLNLLFESAPLINIQEVVLTSHLGAKRVYRKLGFKTSNEIKFNKQEYEVERDDNLVLVLPKKTRERDDDVESRKKSKLTMGGKKSRGGNRSRKRKQTRKK